MIEFSTLWQHLRAIDPEAQFFTLQLVAEAPWVENYRGLTHVITLPMENMQGHLERYQARGSACFVTVNQTDLKGRRQENITHLRAVWQDCDNALAVASIPPMLPASLVLQTSPQKVHRYWLLKKPIPITESNLKIWRALMIKLVTAYNSDPSTVDVSRVLRLAGCQHLKGEPFRTLILDDQSDQVRYSLEQLASVWLGDDWEAGVETVSRRTSLHSVGMLDWRQFLRDQDPLDMGSSGVVLKSDNALMHAHRIVNAENFNNSLCFLASHLATIGIDAKSNLLFLTELMDQVAVKDARWKARVRNLENIVLTATAKYSMIHKLKFSINQGHLDKGSPDRRWYRL